MAAFAGVAALYFSFRRLERQRAALLGAFASTRLIAQLTQSVSLRRIWIKRVAIIAAVACVCAALARPQGAFTTEVTHRSGLDILIAIDTSKSMLTPDVKPNRLTRAKLAAQDLLDNLHGDGVGLVAFAGDAFVEAPITTDYEAYRDAVEALDTNTIPRGGTNIASAIRVAQTTFKARPASDKILILMTDGEDLDAQGVAAAQAATKQGLRIFTVGVGTTAGDLIPVPDGSGGTQYLKDESGEPVRSHLDVATLQQIAQATGGMYVPLGNQGQGLSAIYTHGLASFARHDLAEQSFRVYSEWFQWPLLAGIILLMLEALVSTRRRSPKCDTQQPAPAARHLVRGLAQAVAPAVMVAVGLALTTFAGTAHASASDAEKSYLRGDFARADTQYEASARKRPTEAKLQFNVGAATYKSGDFKTATTAFQSAVKTGAPLVQQGAYYNLGNTEYRVGQQTQQAQPQTTIEHWQAAVKSYDAALQMQPSDADAKFNRDLVQRKLAQLQQQEAQKQAQKQGQKQDQKQSQQQKSSGTQPQKSQGKDGAQGSSAGQKQSQSQGGSPSQGQGQNPAKDQASGQGKKPSQAQNQSSGQGANPAPRNDRSAPPPANGNASAASQQPGQASQPPPAPESSAGTPKAVGTPVAAAGTPPGTQANRSNSQAANAEPGQLTKDEAEHLLDSLKDEEHRLPSASLGLNAEMSANNPPRKDW
jgi:Ca-activated chloride channel family protein